MLHLAFRVDIIPTEKKYRHSPREMGEICKP